MPARSLRLPILAIFTLAALPALGALAGPLDPPPGPIAPSMKPLSKVEPRTAVNAANTPGDANSLFRISQSGSYYLTGNVTGVTGKRAIEIAAPGVTIDLAGFALVGVPGSLSAIAADAFVSNIVVRNGTISSWNGAGVDLNAMDVNAIIENVAVADCTDNGIVGGFNSVVRGCSVARCGPSGILITTNGVVADCAVRQNSGDGITTGLACTITRCSARLNGGDGISAGANSTVSNCATYDNTASGIATASGCTVDHCTATSNDGDGITATTGCVITDCSATGNTDNGIEVISTCLVRGNLCNGNGAGAGDGAGIFITGTDNRVESNSCNQNDRGIDVDAAGNFIVRNTTSGNFNNWDIIAGNRCLVVSSAAGPGISGDSGGASLGSTDPNANFTY